jgi:hypothetical protein
MLLSSLTDPAELIAKRNLNALESNGQHFGLSMPAEPLAFVCFSISSMVILSNASKVLS